MSFSVFFNYNKKNYVTKIRGGLKVIKPFAKFKVGDILPESEYDELDLVYNLVEHQITSNERCEKCSKINCKETKPKICHSCSSCLHMVGDSGGGECHSCS